MTVAGRIHGDKDVQELAVLGLTDVPLLDFAVNLNPFGPPGFLVEAVRAANIVDYPERTSHAARAALARAFTLTPEQVAIGNGACELLWSLARLWRGGTAVMVEPTFSEFAAAMASEGGQVMRFATTAATEFQPDLAALSRYLRQTRADAVYLCNPNNPTGGFIALADIEAVACAHPQTTFILDESFLSLSDHADCAHQPMAAPNVVRVRSLTKDFALAGVRVGYLIAAPALVARLEAVRPPWSVSSLAQAAVEASLHGERFIAESRAKLAPLRDQLARGLQQLGLHVTPSSVNYVLVDVKREATQLRRALLRRHHIVVRDCTSFGLPHHLRLCVRPEGDIRRLLEAMAAAL